MKLAASLALLASPALAAPQNLHCSEVSLVPAAPIHPEGVFPDRLAVDAGVVVVSDGAGPGHPGAVHVFEAGPNGAWSEVQVLTGDAGSNDFGVSVAVAGTTAIVGDWHWNRNELGRVHVFERAPVGGWAPSQVLAAPAGFDSFGSHVALDGAWLAIQGRVDGTLLDHRLFLYERDGPTGAFAHRQTLEPPLGSFRFGSELSLEGDLLLSGDPVGFSAQGQASVFRRDAGGVWSLEQVLTADFPQYPGYFGRGVLRDGEIFLSAQMGTSVLWSARGYRYVFDALTSTWVLAQEFHPNDLPPAGGDLQFMFMEATAGVLLIGTPERDRVMVYRADSAGAYQPDSALTLAGGGFVEGFGDALAAGGGAVAIGSASLPGPGGSGSLWVYDLRLDDCDGNGLLDACELANGAQDVNGNRVLDACEFSGAAFCGPAVPNSTGVAARLTGLGAPLAASALDLCATLMPAGAFGYLLGSAAQDFVAMPGASVGNLCLGGGPDFGRYTDQVQAADASGRACASVDLGAVPTAGPPRALVAGETWNFQYWYRDGVTSNFTAGLMLTVR